MTQIAKRIKLDYIDALRGLAIIGVIMVHTQGVNSGLPNIISKIVGEGAKGVQLFYIASAFTLFLSFKSRTSLENSPIRNFFLRRFFRIAPMYYIGICYYLFQDGFGARYWLGDETEITALNIFSNATFLHGFNPHWINSLVPGGWSIAVEMLFYALLPFIYSKIKNVNDAFKFLILSIVIKLILELLFINFPLIDHNGLWTEYLVLYFPSQLPIFSLGIILYFIVIEQEKATSISGKYILIFSGLILFQLASGTQIIFPNHILFGIGFLFLGLALSKFQFIAIVNPAINYIGKISFSMYLVHFAVLHWLTQFNLINYHENPIINYSTRFFVVTVLTVIVSTLFYQIIEIPFQNIGKKVINKLEKRTAL